MLPCAFLGPSFCCMARLGGNLAEPVQLHGTFDSIPVARSPNLPNRKASKNPSQPSDCRNLILRYKDAVRCAVGLYRRCRICTCAGASCVGMPCAVAGVMTLSACQQGYILHPSVCSRKAVWRTPLASWLTARLTELEFSS